MSDKEQERLDQLEARLEASIIAGKPLIGLTVPDTGGLRDVDDFLYRRGRADLAESLEQNRQEWAAL